MVKIKNKLTNKIYYFRFFSESNKNIFYYTPTIESFGFDFGHISHFEPIGITWEQLYKENK